MYHFNIMRHTKDTNTLTDYVLLFYPGKNRREVASIIADVLRTEDTTRGATNMIIRYLELDFHKHHSPIHTLIQDLF